MLTTSRRLARMNRSLAAAASATARSNSGSVSPAANFSAASRPASMTRDNDRSSSAVRRATLPISLRYRPIESFMSVLPTVGLLQAFPGQVWRTPHANPNVFPHYAPGVAADAYGPHTALLVVDIQNDFADPAGSLYVPGGEEVVDLANREIERALAAGAKVAYSQDWHPPETPHFAAHGGGLPPPSARGTAGDGLHPRLQQISSDAHEGAVSG